MGAAPAMAGADTMSVVVLVQQTRSSSRITINFESLSLQQRRKLDMSLESLLAYNPDSE